MSDLKDNIRTSEEERKALSGYDWSFGGEVLAAHEAAQSPDSPKRQSGLDLK